MLELVSRFSTGKCWKEFLDVHAFQKKNASNELNIFFLNKIEEDFLQ